MAAGLCFGVPQSRASGGDAPWCIINDEGNLHCYYATSQACLQEIASGNRGFCLQNPAGSSAAAAQRRRAGATNSVCAHASMTIFGAGRPATCKPSRTRAAMSR